MHYAPVEPIPDQKEIQMLPITTSRPPSVGPSSRGYPYTSKVLLITIDREK